MDSNKLPELGTRSSILSYSLLALSHSVQTRLSLFTPTVMYCSISWSMLMILLLQVVTSHLSTLLFGNLNLNSQPRILGCYFSSVGLRFWLLP